MAVDSGGTATPTPRLSVVGSAAWSETISASVLDCDVRIDRPQAFQAAVSARPFAGLEFIDVACDRHRTSRTRSHVEADGRACVFMVLPLTGEIRLSQDRRFATLSSGAVGFFDSERPVAVETSDSFHTLCIKIPYRLLGLRRQNLADLTARGLGEHEGPVAATSSMLMDLHGRLDDIDVAGQFKMVRPVVGLIESLLSSVDPSRPVLAPPEEIAIEEIKSHIERNLADPGLGPKSIATAQFMSVRRLHYLFEESGTTVSAWIRDRRVERSMEALADRDLLELPISLIARKWGFRTASHFGQVFKASTGMTPREFRNLRALATAPVDVPQVETIGGLADVECAPAEHAAVDYASLDHLGWPA